MDNLQHSKCSIINCDCWLPILSKQNLQWRIRWGVSIFKGKKKIGEKHFKTEKDMAYYLYLNDKKNG